MASLTPNRPTLQQLLYKNNGRNEKKKKGCFISIGSDLALILPTATITVKRAFSVMNIIECEING